MNNISSRIIKTAAVYWRDLQFLQNDNFKELSPEAREKLKQSLISNNFTQPFYVWQNPCRNIFCLDGKHRTLLLEELLAEGANVPDEQPATFIRCENEKEAYKLVLIYSSIYAKITQQGLYDFVQLADLDYGSMKMEMDIPELSMDRFEQSFDLHQVRQEESDMDTTVIEGETIVKYADLFHLNGHRIICGSFTDEAVLNSLMGEKKARIIFCDPPYNLPANFFTNKDEKRHKDFAMGAGEMTDQQFSDFLAMIMQTSIDHSLPGAIHYICMDWRHVWHMSEAARKVYGSPEPKQLCVWNKDLMANGSFYRAKHELVFAFQNKGAKHLWNNDIVDAGGFYKNNQELVFIFKNGDAKHLSHLDLKDRIRSNVWNYPSATSTDNPDRYELKNHPTPKPVKMVADAILDTTNEGDVVADWFLGSGTTMISAEKTSRFCYGTEIEPRYVQHDIQRYITYCNRSGIEVNFKHLNGTLKLEDFAIGSK